MQRTLLCANESSWKYIIYIILKIKKEQCNK
jgi:hypothetical protein